MKKSTLVVLLAGLPLFSLAQDDVSIKTETSDKHRVMTNKFWNNWFITAGAGAQVMFADDDEKGDFGKRISPALNVGIGKWFTPGLGVRLQYSGLSVKGFGFSNGGYIEGTPDATGLRKEKWNYMNIHGDIMLDLTNMFCGYKEDRIYSAIPYLGFGLVHRLDADKYGHKKVFYGGNIGMVNRFRLSNAWDFNLEANALLMKDDFDSKNEGTKMDAVISLTAGFTYKFKQRGFSRTPAPTVISTGISTEEMNNIRGKMNEQIAQINQLERELASEKNKKTEVIKQPEITSSAPGTVFFKLNEANISSRERVNIKYIAELIKQNPNKTFTIVGYADEATGTPEYNYELSQHRADNVYNMLVGDFGVRPAQLKVVAKGGVSNLYDSEELNRVVIIE